MRYRGRCINCGMPIPDMPEDASYDELLCDRYYEEHEQGFCQYCLNPLKVYYTYDGDA